MPPRQGSESTYELMDALLLRRTNLEIGSRKALVGADEATKLRAGISKYVAIIVIMLAAQRIAASPQLSA
jgi:hypothetical protein